MHKFDVVLFIVVIVLIFILIHHVNTGWMYLEMTNYPYPYQVLEAGGFTN